MAELKLTSKGEEIEKQLPGGKVKKKAVPEVVLEISTRSKKKCVTTILGACPSLPADLSHLLLRLLTTPIALVVCTLLNRMAASQHQVLAGACDVLLFWVPHEQSQNPT